MRAWSLLSVFRPLAYIVEMHMIMAVFGKWARDQRILSCLGSGLLYTRQPAR